MIDAQFRFNQCNSFREAIISVFSHMVLCSYYDLWWWPSWISDHHKKHKLNKRPFNDHSCTEWVHSAQQFLRKRFFLYFPIWYCVKTMSCIGSHLGFRIDIKNPNFRGPSNDYSWAVWFQLSKWLKRSVLDHFPHRVQCYTKSCHIRHFEFHIGTKNLVCRGPSNEHSCTVWL